MSSFATNLLSLINLRNSTQSTTNNQNAQLNSSISTLNTSIQKLSDNLRADPFVALNGNNGISVNQAANTVLMQGVPVPVGYRLVLDDFNVTFTTSGGTVSIVIMDYNGKNVVNTITQQINSSASGFGGTVLDQTTCVAIIVNTQGAGVVQTYISGHLKKMVNYQ